MLTFTQWFLPFVDKVSPSAKDAAEVAWHAAQEAMKERAARACEGYEVGEVTPPTPGDGPDCWDWHSKDYAKAVRDLVIL
jgi:hypothetical protein